MPFEVIEKLATATGHLEKPAAGMEVLAMGAQVLGQVIDPGGEQRDLDFARAGVLVVDFVFSYDFGFCDCWHGYSVGLHDCRCLCRPRAARPALSRSEAGGTVAIRRGAESVMVESRDQRGFTNGSLKSSVGKTAGNSRIESPLDERVTCEGLASEAARCTSAGYAV